MLVKAFRISWRSDGPAEDVIVERPRAIAEDARSESTSNLLSVGSQRYVEKQVYYVGDRDLQPWQPRVFHWTVFATLLITFATLITLSEIFIHFSIHVHDGFPVLPRALACIPVIVALVLGMIWHMLDLESRKLSPWAPMRREPQPAFASVLLDYFSPVLPLRLAQAVRHRHWSVVLTSLGLPLVAATIVISTSIWTTHSTTRFAPEHLAITSTLNTSRFDPTSTDQTYLHLFLSSRSSGSEIPWTDAVHAIDSFAPVTRVPPHTPIQGLTNGSRADLVCQAASASYAGNVSIADPLDSGKKDVRQQQLIVTAAGCTQTHNFTITSGQVASAPVPFGYVLTQSCSSSSISTILVHGALADGSLSSLFAVSCAPTYNTTILRVLVDSTTQTLLTSPTHLTSSPLSFPQGSSLLVSMDSALASTTATYWTHTNGTTPVDDSHFLRRRDPFTNWNVTPPFSANLTYPGDFTPWFHLLGHALGLTTSDLTDDNDLTLQSKTLFAMLWPSFARTELFSTPASGTPLQSGSVQLTQNRLFARTGPLRAIEACLAALLILSAALYPLRPAPRLPRDPASLAFLLGLMQTGEDAREAMRYTSTFSSAMLRDCMTGWRFAVRGTSSGNVAMKAEWDPSETYHVVSQHREAAPTFWRPLMLHPVATILLLSAIGGIIAALEVTSLVSDRRGGFRGTLSHNLWTYAVPVILLLLGIVVLRIVFALSTVEPFQALTRDPLPAKRALGPFGFTTTPLFGLWTGVYRRQFAVAVGGLGLLWLLASGVLTALLFVEKHPQIAQQVDLALINTFVDVPEFSADQQRNVAEQFVLSELPGTAVQLPPWTTRYQAIGQVNLSSAASHAHPTTTLVAPLPVLEAELSDCVSVNPADFSMSRDGVFAVPSRPGCDIGNATLFQPGFRGWFGAAVRADCVGGVIGMIGRVGGDGSLQNTTMRTFVSFRASMQVTLALGPGANFTIEHVDASSAVDIHDYPSVLNDTNFWPAFPTYMDTNTSHSFDGFMQTMTLSQQNVPIDDYTNPQQLIEGMQNLWSAYWAYWGSATARTPTTSGTDALTANLSFSRPRVVQDRPTTHIVQAFLGALLVCLIVSAVMARGAGSVLLKAPYSIAAQMSLLEGNRLVDDGVTSVVAYSPQDERSTIRRRWPENHLDGYWFKLGWVDISEGMRRYGVDVVPRP
ncbi:hypothetical protein PUNSTDRAFT_143463 [Punctularia strigosozonata HHB-11173 SS5]|uniref:uncharacterized protein n=1 Tax=Punctularia strigosozonata (strain HHB-11173) TaxID=741275 RepID=UPI0004418593|nr:uncharacterized protein PUNSTDRAFT_143463 [Punctularia strigosozonata HHB-11173 SS5]EIN08727.1 hypothetical protein PUNSTDRAFT_143463 [Punctularia strigosozonata HHB-11173 SS5]